MIKSGRFVSGKSQSFDHNHSTTVSLDCVYSLSISICLSWDGCRQTQLVIVTIFLSEQKMLAIITRKGSQSQPQMLRKEATSGKNEAGRSTLLSKGRHGTLERLLVLLLCDAVALKWLSLHTMLIVILTNGATSLDVGFTLCDVRV